MTRNGQQRRGEGEKGAAAGVAAAAGNKAAAAAAEKTEKRDWEKLAGLA